MAKIRNVHELDITPEKYLRACTREELIELDLLLAGREFQMKMQQPVVDADIENDPETADWPIEWKQLASDHIPAGNIRTKLLDVATIKESIEKPFQEAFKKEI